MKEKNIFSRLDHWIKESKQNVLTTLEWIHLQLSQNAYFKENAHHLTLECLSNGNKKSEGLWAFVDCNHAQTVLMVSKYADTCNAEAVPLSLDESEQWLYGPDGLNLKANLLLQMDFVEKHTAKDNAVNLLWIILPKEEDYPQVVNQGLALIHDLKEKLSVEFLHFIDSESYFTEGNKPLIHLGLAGKIEPFVLVKTKKLNRQHFFEALSSVSLMTEIIKAVDMNVELSSRCTGQMSLPPSVQGVQLMPSLSPEGKFSGAAFHFNLDFYHRDLKDLMHQLKELVIWASEDAINQLNYSYNEFLRKQKKPSFEKCHDIDFKVYLWDEFMSLNGLGLENIERLPKYENTNQFLNDLWERLSLLDNHENMAVIGLLPNMYYPYMLEHRITLLKTEEDSFYEKRAYLDESSYIFKWFASLKENVFLSSQCPVAVSKSHLTLEGLNYVNVGIRVSTDQQGRQGLSVKDISRYYMQLLDEVVKGTVPFTSL